MEKSGVDKPLTVGTWGLTTDIRAHMPSSLLFILSASFWASFSPLVARWPSAALDKSIFFLQHLQRTQYSSYWPTLGLVLLSGRKKNLSGQGPGPWVGLGLNHKLLLKLGWRSSPSTAGEGRKLRV